jgi:hypothetical protein
MPRKISTDLAMSNIEKLSADCSMPSRPGSARR